MYYFIEKKNVLKLKIVLSFLKLDEGDLHISFHLYEFYENFGCPTSSKLKKVH